MNTEEQEEPEGSGKAVLRIRLGLDQQAADAVTAARAITGATLNEVGNAALVHYAETLRLQAAGGVLLADWRDGNKPTAIPIAWPNHSTLT